MKTKIIGMVICMLLTTTTIPVITSLNEETLPAMTLSHNDPQSAQTDWREMQKILASSFMYSRFGNSVSLDGDTALVGTPLFRLQSGGDDGEVCVYTHTGTTWTQETKLYFEIWEGSFGSSVSLSGDTALIGVPYATYNGTQAGQAVMFTRNGTNWTMQQYLHAPDSAAYNYFGCSVSLNGDTALIGAPGNDAFRGAAYVYTYNGINWTFQQKLFVLDGVAGDQFGSCVSLDGDTALIGTYYYPRAAYVFTRTNTTWIQQEKLIPSDGYEGQGFGCSVALDGNTALIGANLANIDGLHDGAAYVFTYNGTNWTQQQKLIASDHTSGDRFGSSVALDGDTVFIGAIGDLDYGFFIPGKAYVFTYNGTTWTEQQKLLPSDSIMNDCFSWSISLDGDTAFIGAPQGWSDEGQGAAYGFKLIENNWTQEQRLFPKAGHQGDCFGETVSLDGNTALIGASHTDYNRGAAYIYTCAGDTWTLQQKLYNSTGEPYDWFGWDVSLDGNTAFIGAPGEDARGGAVYVYTRTGTTWTLQQKLFALDPDGSGSDEFGYPISLDGDTAFIGARRHHHANNTCGAVYVFTYNGTNWTQQQEIVSPVTLAYFPDSISVKGNTALIGDANANGICNKSGAVYVYIRSGNTWIPKEKFFASDGSEGDDFGYSVSLSGYTALIGAQRDYDENGTWPGSAYIFTYNGYNWTQQQKLRALDDGSFFGHSVSLYGNTALIGALWSHGNANRSGAAYVFTYNGTIWTQQKKLVASDGEWGDDFGNSVSLDGNTALIGAVYDDDNGDYSGSAYVFKSNSPPAQPYNPTPNDGAVDVFVTEDLLWYAPDPDPEDTVTYDVYFGTIDPPPKIISNQSTNTYDPGILIYNMMYYWQIVAWDNHGHSTPGPLWRFTTEKFDWLLRNKTIGPSGEDGDRFGWSVCISGDYAIVGAPYHEVEPPAGSFAGSAYIYKRSGTNWTFEQQLTASNHKSRDYFGSSVSIDGDYAIVGAPYHDGTQPGRSNMGSTYIFKRSGMTWMQEAELNASDGDENDYFGWNVSISGDRVIIGAPYDDTAYGVDAGSAYVFNRSGTTWAEEDKLIAAYEIGGGDNFGGSVSLDGTTAIIGAQYDDNEKGQDAGAAYIFKKTDIPGIPNWTMVAKLTAIDGVADDHFGRSVSISNDSVVIGAPTKNSSTGSAYVFRGTPAPPWVWQQEAKLLPEEYYYYFGSAVSISGDCTVIGAYNCYTPNGVPAGSAFAFKRFGTNWTEEKQLVAWDGDVNDEFGYSVSLNGNYTIIGAPFDDNAQGTDAGSAYIFENVNSPPYKPYNPTPPNGTTDVVITINLSWISIGDPDEGDTVTYDVYFGTASPLLRVSSNQSELTYTPGTLAYSTTYYWQIVAWDNHRLSTPGPVWVFTTLMNYPPVFSTPSPTNGSTENPLSFTWAISINDPDGDMFSWSIQCSNGQTNSGSGASNGTKSLSLSDLVNATTYIIWVNATDPTGSDQFTRRWYSFTTKDPDWPIFGHDLTHSRYSSSLAPDTNAIRWSYSTGGEVFSSPAVADGKIYIGSFDNKVYCLDAETGGFVWSYTTGGDIQSSPAVANGKVYVGSCDYKVYCLDAETGEFVWSYTTGSWVDSSPAVTNGKVYVGSSYGNVLCLDAETGEFVWRYYTGNIVYSSPAVANGKVYVGSDDYKVYCLDAETGGFVWSYTTGNVVMSSPAVTNGKVYVGSSDKVYCLDAATGGRIWSYLADGDISSSPAVADGKVYVGSSFNNMVYCLNAETGGFIWSYTTVYMVLSSPAVAYGRVYVGSGDYKVLCFGPIINQPPGFGAPSPANGSINNPLSFSWSIPINDLEGNQFSWTIQCSNGQTNNSTGATNGTKILQLSELACSTTYTVWVNVTDPDGSGLYTRRWYWFTTQNYSVVQPYSYTIKRGMYSSGDLADLYESDDQYLSILAGFTMTAEEPPVWVEIEGTAPLNTPSQLMFTLEAHKNTAGMIIQTIKLFNYTSGHFETLDSRTATTADQIVTITLTNAAAHYIHPETKQMKAQYMWKQTGPISMFPWKISIDESNWAVWY